MQNAADNISMKRLEGGWSVLVASCYDTPFAADCLNFPFVFHYELMFLLCKLMEPSSHLGGIWEKKLTTKWSVTNYWKEIFVYNRHKEGEV